MKAALVVLAVVAVVGPARAELALFDGRSPATIVHADGTPLTKAAELLAHDLAVFVPDDRLVRITRNNLHQRHGLGHIFIQRQQFKDRIQQHRDAIAIAAHQALGGAGGWEVAIRDDEFIYVESVNSYVSEPAGEGIPATQAKNTKLDARQDRRVWLSVDGAHNGLLEERLSGGTWTRTRLDGCIKGMTPPQTKGTQTVPGQPCKPRPEYHPELPATIETMKAWLYEISRGGNPPDEQAWVTVGDTIREAYIPVRARAAMFEAAARIPGVYVVKNVTDAVGRAGIAVARDWHGLRSELIFDATTYAFLGERVVDLTPGPDSPSGTVIGYSAVARVAIVPEVGQLP